MTKTLIPTRFLAAFVSLILLMLPGAAPVYAQDGEANADDDKTLYYLGMSIGRNLEMLQLSEDEAEELVEGLEATLANEAENLDDAVYTQKVNEFTQQRMAAARAREQSASEGYLTIMAAEEGAVTSESGLIYRELLAGDGVQPTAVSSVRAHYKGTLRTGDVFDSSYDRGEPLTIALNQVIPCWTEGIVKMREGGKAKLTCPSDIAYGERGSGSIPPGAVLTFEVELIDVVE